MVKYIKIRGLNNSKVQPEIKNEDTGTAYNHNEIFTESQLKNIKISDSLNENMNKINEIIGSNVDLITRSFTIGRSDAKQAVVFYFDNKALYVSKNSVRNKTNIYE